MQYKNIIIHMLLAPDVGPQAITKIVESVGLDNLQRVYQMSVLDFISFGVSQKKAESLVAALVDNVPLQKELNLIAQYQVTIVTAWCQQYSPLLKQIDTPPVVLYCLGNTDLFQASKTIACVGARKAHGYAKQAIEHIIVPMIHDGWTIVSGGAAGADTYAHQITLDQRGSTVVVVGSGLCHVYPPQNRVLFEKVVYAGGLIVSCFPMNTNPDSWCFPIRNRIISGLSRGCLVVQAATKSGALITAQQALDQGRDVFAVPGLIFDPLSAGCHELIAQGAKLVSCAADILSELDVSYTPVHEQQTIMNAVNVPAASTRYKPDSLQQQILNILITPLSADTMMQKLNVNIDQLQSLLFDLSLDGVIGQNATGFWVRI